MLGAQIDCVLVLFREARRLPCGMCDEAETALFASPVIEGDQVFICPEGKFVSREPFLSRFSLQPSLEALARRMVDAGWFFGGVRGCFFFFFSFFLGFFLSLCVFFCFFFFCGLCLCVLSLFVFFFWFGVSCGGWVGVGFWLVLCGGCFWGGVCGCGGGCVVRNER